MKQKKEYEKGIINNNNGSVYVRTSKYPKVTKKPYTITYNYNDKIKGESYGWLVA